MRLDIKHDRICPILYLQIEHHRAKVHNLTLFPLIYFLCLFFAGFPFSSLVTSVPWFTILLFNLLAEELCGDSFVGFPILEIFCKPFAVYYSLHLQIYRSYIDAFLRRFGLYFM